MRGPVVLLKDAWTIFASNPKLFVGIYLVPGILTLLYVVLTDGREADMLFRTATDILLFTVFMIAIIIANIFMGIALMRAVAHPGATTIRGAYEEAKPFFISYLVLSFFVGIVTLLGFILLIIPGIIFSVWFAFSYFVLLFEGKKGTEAMKASKELVKGRFWAVLGRYAFLILIGIIFSIALGIVLSFVSTVVGELGGALVSLISNMIIVPVLIAYTYLMYLDLSKTGAVTQVTEVVQREDSTVVHEEITEDADISSDSRE